MTGTFKALVISAALLAFAGGTAANAVTFGVAGVTDPVNNTATVDFTYDGIDTITVEIENTAGGLDPRITGFAFNLPNTVTGFSSFSASGFTNAGAWFDVFDPDGVNTPGNNGMFDAAGFNSNGQAINGGSANNGIIFGETAIFEFVLEGSDLGLLTEASFLDLLSSGGNNAEFFAVRFQRTGPNGEGSDIAFPTTVVPVPAALPLFLTALAGAGFMARRRKRNA